MVPVAVPQPAPESPTVDVSTQNTEVTDSEWTYDPNEPRYCLCNQVSYGDMVACDNEDVRDDLEGVKMIFKMCYCYSVRPSGSIIRVWV